MKNPINKAYVKFTFWKHEYTATVNELNLIKLLQFAQDQDEGYEIKVVSLVEATDSFKKDLGSILTAIRYLPKSGYVQEL